MKELSYLERMKCYFDNHIKQIADTIGVDWRDIEVSLTDDCGLFGLKLSRNNNAPQYVAWWAIGQMPACPNVCLSYHANIEREYAGRGLGKLLNNLRINAAKHAGFTAMLCTVSEDNKPQIKILNKNGWRHISTIQGERGNILLYTINLNK